MPLTNTGRVRAIHIVTEALLESYRKHGGINHVGGVSLPSRAEVAEILLDVEELCFPGFVRDRELDADNLAYVTGARVASVAERLTRQISVELAGREQRPVSEETRAQARELAMELLGALPDLRQRLDEDVQALLDGDPAARAKEEIILAYPGLRAIVVHRVAHQFWRRGLRLLARMMSEDVHGRTGIDIHPGAQIGRSFYIDHGTGVVVGETTIIGDHVKLYQGVSLGALSVSKKVQDHKRHPTLEDHVTIYAGATILGGETVVGHHSVVGGNVWLVSSIPPHSVVEHEAKVKVRGKARPDPLDSSDL